MYNKITEEDIKKFFNDITPKDSREFVVYCTDIKDGVFKNLKDTQQFDEALKQQANIFLKESKDIQIFRRFIEEFNKIGILLIEEELNESDIKEEWKEEDLWYNDNGY